MKNILFRLFLVFSLCGFSSLSDQASTIIVETKNSDWEIANSSGAVVKAFHKESQTEFSINLSSLLPTSTYCMSNKKVKDIKFDISIHKVAKEGETNWEKAYEKTIVKFSGKAGTKEKKVQYLNLIKNNFKAKAGVLNIGKIEFISPFTCDEIDDMNIRISGMKNGNKNLPAINFKIKIPENQ